MASSSKQPSIAANTSVLTPAMTLEGHKPYMLTLSEGDRQEFKYIPYISYFPDGKQMISGSYDKTIRRWDLREGKEIKEAREVYKDRVHGVRVSRDGRWVVTVVDEVLKVCEVETGIMRTFHDDLMTLKCIEISADSTLLAGESYDGIQIWSLDTGKLVAGPFRSTGVVVDALGLSQDSRKLAVTSCNFDQWESKFKQYLEVWDVQSQKLVVTREGSNTRGWINLPVFWTTKGKSITAVFASESDDIDTIHEFDASTLKTVGDSFQGHTDHIWSLALSFDCLLLASASSDTIKLWSFESRQLLASFNVQALHSLILSPDSHQLAYTTLNEARIYVCDIPANILASIGLAKETSAHLAKLLDVCGPALLLI
ncbi:quinon protein alcohol dehydrogenase-like superfamily [Suillus plorans]|uniref:Quinon protein alcohol dehydrogenase-like superfamily n=1 Tax=Suillus plorans TaxID=116603 RepID=A0A9P7ACI2_9AGAM|nr:quinon protein alcohol dehydrogenase-like superfamily [Suillus plorans]KAG1786468.1 quinon protein alcohol dehydrogenase-like superfamily [Suillus plorans]